MEHTEGEWTIEYPCGFPYSGTFIVPVIRKDFPYYIAEIRQLREHDESFANAELIASAPTLKVKADLFDDEAIKVCQMVDSSIFQDRDGEWQLSRPIELLKTIADELLAKAKDIK